MEQPYIAPRFICKSILKTADGWMVTFPDYESAGENPFAVREATRLMDSREVLEWVERRLLRLGGVLAKPLVEEEEVPPPLEVPKLKPSGARVRTTLSMKKLKCGHLHPRRKGVYPRRCASCQKHFDERIAIMRKKMR